MDEFTEKQIKALAIMPSITCPLSLLGSAAVIYMIHLRKESKLSHRILKAICIVDVLISAVGMFGPMPVPEETGVFLAKGNTITCSFQGLVGNFTLTVLFYNTFLMFTFLSMIRYEKKEEDIVARYEKLMHIVAIGYPLVSGVLALTTTSFNPVLPLGNLRCYITPYPDDCDVIEDLECTRGEHARKILLFLVIVPLVLCVSYLFVSVFLIWWTVYQNDRKARHTQYNVRNTSRAVAVQSIIYGIFFFNTYVWIGIFPLVNIIAPHTQHSTGAVVVRFLNEIFYWSQGFFTFLIYIRPRYIKIRKGCPDESTTWVLREVLVGKSHADRYNSRNHSMAMTQPKSSVGFKKQKTGIEKSNISEIENQSNLRSSLRVQPDGSVIAREMTIGDPSGST